MGLVKICATCQHVNLATTRLCKLCSVSLEAVESCDESAIPDTLSTVARPDLAAPVCPECGARNRMDAANCVYCNALLGRNSAVIRTESAFYVAWPWGEETYQGLLRIGRDPPAPPGLIDKLARRGFDNISRSHAEIFAEGGELFVRDLGSRNGTFVGGQRLTPNVQVKLSDNAAVLLASDLTICVRKAKV